MHLGSERLLERASRAYRACGRYAWHFGRGKLRHDPFFLSVLRGGILPDAGRLVDVGCGQGLLLALLCAARDEYAEGRWPEGWPAPPRDLELHGIEVERRRVEVARRALATLDPSVRIECSDAQRAMFPPCSVITFIDVLLYLKHDEQQEVLRRAIGALEPGGLVIVREADGAGGLRFQITRYSERLGTFGQGKVTQPRYYRTADEWRALLGSLGVVVDSEPMSAGTPFANVLFVGRVPAARQ